MEQPSYKSTMEKPSYKNTMEQPSYKSTMEQPSYKSSMEPPYYQLTGLSFSTSFILLICSCCITSFISFCLRYWECDKLLVGFHIIIIIFVTGVILLHIYSLSSDFDIWPPIAGAYCGTILGGVWACI